MSCSLHTQHKPALTGYPDTHAGAGNFLLAAQSTVHCLTGCAIGEFAGLAIGVTLGFTPWATMALATTLSFISGYTLGLVPLVKVGRSWFQAFRMIWFGETVSISVMELVMNFTDYHVGGVQVASMLDPRFWIGFLLAIPAGYLAALPVNWWLLKSSFRKPCH